MSAVSDLIAFSYKIRLLLKALLGVAAQELTQLFLPFTQAVYEAQGNEA